jgi:hypothetical protein
VQTTLSPLPDWKGDMPADRSRHVWLEKVSSLLDARCPIDQPEERQSVIFVVASDGIDGPEGERISTDYHQG